jgi:hypothetical protein
LILSDLLVAGGLFGLLLAALEVGYRAGRRESEDGGAGSSQVGAIQGAVLGLFGLLLGFSFAAAGTRFLERQDLIVTEANAIGTAFLRADLLDEPHRSELRSALERYTSHRLELSAHIRRGLSAADHEEIARLHARIWSAARAGVTARPATMLAVLAPVNEVIDLHALRLGASRKHLPLLVLGLLIACSAIAVAVIGYGCGMGGRRRTPMTTALAILIGTGLWITIDLDHPRAGLMQLSDAPLAELSFGAPSE